MAFNLGDIFVTLKAKTEGIEQGLQKMQQVADDVEKHNKGLGRLADGMTNLGQKMTLGLTVPLAAFGAVAFKASADFDKTMTQVGIASKAAGEEVEALTALAEKMGAETVFSAQDAADAMLALAKGGLTAAQIQAGALAATLTMATAGGIELGAAANYMANGLQMFGLDATRAGEVAAALAGGANASTASIESMGLALSQVGPGAKLAGLSLQETVAALAAFDNAGIKGSDAGTSLKVMLLNLVPVTAAAKEQMKDLGIEFTNADGSFKSLGDIAQILKEKVGGLTAEQQQLALKTMFGTDAFRAAAILMGQGKEGIDKYTEATSDLGAAQKLADANMQGSAGTIERMKGAWETFVKLIGDVVAPVFVDLLEFFTKLLDKFKNLSPWMQKAIVIFAAIVAVVGPLLLLLGLMANAIIGIATAMAILNISLGPLLLVILAVAALIALAVIVWKNWSKISNFFKEMWEGIKNIFSSVIDWIKNNWDLLLTILLGPIGFFVSMVIKHWDDIKNAFMTAVNAIVTFATEVWNFLYNGIIKPVIDLIIAYFNIWWNVVYYIFAVFRGLVIVTFEFLWGSVIKPFIDLVVGIFNFLWEHIQAIFTAIRDFIAGVWNWLWSNVISPVINAIKGAIHSIWDKVVEIFNAIKGFVAGVWNWIWDNAIAPAVNRIKNGFQNIWEKAVEVFNKIKDFVGGVADSITGAFSKGFEGAKNILKSAVNWMIDRVNDVIGAVNNSAGKLPGVPNIPKISRLANGIMNFVGGFARVGETGPELVALPQGADVYSNTKSRGMMAQSGGGGSGTVIQVYLDGANITSPHVADQYATAIGDGIIRKLQQNTRL